MPLTFTQMIVGLVILIQIVISVSELFFWKKRYQGLEPRVVLTKDEADKVTPIIMNAGLYNSFLAAGLIWGLATTTEPLEIQTFFLVCVFVAGIFGALTLTRKTLVIQTVPSLAALIAIWYRHFLV